MEINFFFDVAEPISKAMAESGTLKTSSTDITLLFFSLQWTTTMATPIAVQQLLQLPQLLHSSLPFLRNFLSNCSIKFPVQVAKEKRARKRRAEGKIFISRAQSQIISTF
jgi:hypothetical protein